jgi:hypothetical protein
MIKILLTALVILLLAYYAHLDYSREQSGVKAVPVLVKTKD